MHSTMSTTRKPCTLSPHLHEWSTLLPVLAEVAIRFTYEPTSTRWEEMFVDFQVVDFMSWRFSTFRQVFSSLFYGTALFSQYIYECKIWSWAQQLDQRRSHLFSAFSQSGMIALQDDVIAVMILLLHFSKFGCPAALDFLRFSHQRMLVFLRSAIWQQDWG